MHCEINGEVENEMIKIIAYMERLKHGMRRGGVCLRLP